MRRTVLITVALVASHGVALWLGRQSPAGNNPAGTGKPAPAAVATPNPGQKPGSDLAAFLRSAAKEAEAAAERDAPAEVERDEEVLLAAAKAAIPADADVAALVKAATADPDLEISIEARAAFGLWVDRDPVAALRWFVGWAPDASDSSELGEEFVRHLAEGGMDKLGLYLRECPLVREELIAEVSEICEDREPESVLRLLATLDSPDDRRELLSGVFGDPAKFTGRLVQIRALLDERRAAEFLAQLSFEPAGPERVAEVVAELRRAGFPEHAIAQFVLRHSQSRNELSADVWHRPGQSRTNADFIGTIPGVPAATGTNGTDIVTGGLRGGDGAINRNNIDAVLNNPNRTARTSVTTADAIRNAFQPGNGVAWGWFPGGEFEGVPGYAECREDFLRGKLTGEEWITRLQQEIPGSGDLHDGIAAMVFRLTVMEDPRRAMSLLDAGNPHRSLIMQGAASAPPELMLSLADLFSGGGDLPEDLKQGMGDRLRDWLMSDPESLTAMYDELPPAVEKAFYSQSPDQNQEQGQDASPAREEDSE